MAANETSHPIIAPSTTKEGRHFIGANHPDSDAISKCFIHWHSRLIPQRHAAISSCLSPIRPIQSQPSSRFPGSPIAQHGPFGKDRRRIKAQWLFTGSPSASSLDQVCRSIDRYAGMTQERLEHPALLHLVGPGKGSACPVTDESAKTRACTGRSPA